MGSLRGGDGDGRPPPDDGDLPDFPPEWGVVVIPDDLTELDREAAALQRERRRQSRRAKWRRRVGLPVTNSKGETPPVGVPLLIMSIAIIAALTSLFAITLTSRSTRQPQQTNAPAAVPQESPQMIDLALTNASNQSVRLRNTLPAVLLLLDGCACDQLVRDSVAAAPPGVTVIAIDRTAPVLPVGLNVTTLADPEQALLATYADGPDRGAQPAGVPTAVLVAGDGTVTKVVSPASKLVDFKTELTALG